MIDDKVLHENWSSRQSFLEYAPNRGMLPNWMAQYKKNGYPIVGEQEGEYQIGRKRKKTWEEMTDRAAQEENERLRTEASGLLKS